MEVYKLAKLIAIISFAITTVISIFLALKRIKTYCRLTQG